MIKCKKCETDKNYNQYYVTGRGMNKICKTCLNNITKEKNDD